MKQEKITPCLWYHANANEAAALYTNAFRNTRIATTSPYVVEMAIGDQHLILLEGGPRYSPNPSISLFYICQTEEEVDQAWNALSDGGSVMMELGAYPWSARYGWINDRFGVSWQIAHGKLEEVGQRLTPSFLFAGSQFGRAEEAIEFYATVFKNVKADGILRFGPDEAPEKEGTVKHAQIAMEGQKFMFMDSALEHAFTFTEGMSLTIYCDTQDEIDYYWNKLTEGGEESMCGWLKDRFGISWQVVPNILSQIMRDPDRAGKAAQAFMSMRKLVIDQIVKASLA